MEILEFKFQGFTTYDYDGNFPTIKLIDEEIEIDLVKKFRAIFDLYEKEVSVKYILSDNKKSENEILESLIYELSGSVEAVFEENSYNHSSWTYGTDYDTFLKIGGHDLFNELRFDSGKWLFIKITVKL